MSHINEWAKGKPLPLAMIAIELAFDAEYCFECAEQIKKIDEDIPDSPESFAKAIQRERRNWENAFNNARNFN